MGPIYVRRLKKFPQFAKFPIGPELTLDFLLFPVIIHQTWQLLHHSSSTTRIGSQSKCCLRKRCQMNFPEILRCWSRSKPICWHNSSLHRKRNSPDFNSIHSTKENIPIWEPPRKGDDIYWEGSSLQMYSDFIVHAPRQLQVALQRPHCTKHKTFHNKFVLQTHL